MNGLCRLDRQFTELQRQLERKAVGFGELKVEQAKIRGLGSGAHRAGDPLAGVERIFVAHSLGATCAIGVPDGFAALTAGDPDDLERYVRRSPTQCVDQHSNRVFIIPSRASMCTLSGAVSAVDSCRVELYGRKKFRQQLLLHR
jgi:hypothetical protein